VTPVKPSSVAAVDCGTNSTRLLVARADGSTIERLMQITRLGEGVDRTGRLKTEAINRTMATLVGFRETMRAAGVTAVMATATSAVRDASNAAEFLDQAEEVIGVRPRVLPGDEEGRLSYRGATAELDGEGGPYLVVDIGGGSTELVTTTATTTTTAAGGVEAVSLDVGCVRVTERWLASDPPTASELGAARAQIAGLVREAAAEHPAFAAAKGLIGLAGTVSALTRLNLALVTYDRAAIHHASLTLRDIERLTSELAAIRLEARRQLSGMERDRADVLIGGALVLGTVMTELGYDELMASESDILDGIVAGLLDS
jgi:exopolyphosphatase/guanosine-5'-triphosphate,3'-diphosphate pyrophosphatase